VESREASPNATEEEIRAFATYFRQAASPGAEEALGRMNIQIDIRNVLPAIRIPTLVLHHTNDAWVEVERGRDLAQRIPGANFVELPGNGHIPPVAEVGPVLDEIERFLSRAWEADVEESEPDRVLATVLFTDIVGSTERTVVQGDRAWARTLGEHHAVVRGHLDRFRGREMDTAGDGFFATFDGPLRAIRCADAVTRSLREIGIDIRAGIHTGECEIVGDKVGGLAVNIGARVAAKAEAGEILVSQTVRDLVAGSGLLLKDRGVATLKGVPGEWRLYAVADAASPSRHDLCHRPVAAIPSRPIIGKGHRSHSTFGPWVQ